MNEKQLKAVAKAKYNNESEQNAFIEGWSAAMKVSRNEKLRNIPFIKKNEIRAIALKNEKINRVHANDYVKGALMMRRLMFEKINEQYGK